MTYCRDAAKGMNVRPEVTRFCAPGIEWRMTGEDGGCGRIRINRVTFFFVASWGMGWDHVSISQANRCPTWDEMCAAKDLFFGPDECVMQLHPEHREYVNNHPYCLHPWKPQGVAIPKPPAIFVGVPNVA